MTSVSGIERIRIGPPGLARLIGLLLVAIVCSGCTTFARSSGARFVTFDTAEIPESSGLAASSRAPGVFWTLNDSGGEPRIFAIDREGRITGSARIDGVENVDWEAIATDRNGRLFIGDVGNNANRRQDLAIHVIAEPDPGSVSSVGPIATIRVRYPEQQGFPDPAQMNFDAEALFWWKDDLYLLTKHRSDHASSLYRVPSTEDREVDLELVGGFDTGNSMVTAAEMFPVRDRLAVLTYHGLWLFELLTSSGKVEMSQIKTIGFSGIVTRQCEAVAWDGEAIVFTNEQGEMHRIERPMSPTVTHYP